MNPCTTLMPKTLVSDKTGAQALSIGRTKFWGLVKDGKLTPIKLGTRCTRFRSDQILELVENGI